MTQGRSSSVSTAPRQSSKDVHWRRPLLCPHNVCGTSLGTGCADAAQNASEE
eukprot:CAMPEP_0194533924 /NCGR_PEP_ID=MMETSP0253-20130528/71924_1 /TAXON_ID=2966 /ORGANISM="Noctiluca scintillans" /LENGTH=51 /DNA_ID=CAMNT_0039379511 /DNA_START=191 /DNA_END=343 /DNA_ORIENTATION=-